MKRFLPLVLSAAMLMTTGAAALADNVSDALEKAATMTNDELYAKAQEEMAAGAQLNFYSTTSFAEKAAANFMQAYPALDGKVIYAEIDDGESYTILTNTIGSGVKDSADMALTQNGADLKTYLLDDGLSYAYFPKALESVVDEQYREPAVVTFVNSLLIYNNTDGSVGYKGGEVKNAIYDVVDYAEQKEQLGTGHAVKCAKDFIGTDGDTLVLCGDTPLITGRTLTELVEKHRKEANGVTVLSAILDDATGYGRIIRDAAGNFEKIVEHKDATEEERACKEVNSGMYIFNSEALSASLDLLSNDNAAGEYYLTDTIALIKKIGLKVSALPLTGDACDEIRGVNTIDQLEEAEQIMCNREA